MFKRINTNKGPMTYLFNHRPPTVPDLSFLNVFWSTSSCSKDFIVLNFSLSVSYFAVTFCENEREYYFNYESLHVKNNNLGFQPGPTQTGLHSNRRQLEA